MSDFTAFQLTTLFLVLVCYHVAEYLLAKHYHPKETKSSSFLITPEYLIAFTVGLIEYFIERHFWPEFKTNSSSLVLWFGVLMIIVGLYIRFSAILTAGKSFNHVIQDESKGNKLITHGIYKYVRHPGYLGFFIFAVGTQIMLKNIISTIGFIAVLWYFFYDRIIYEERFLVQMYGKDYIEYRNKTPTWIPFIK
ncbi:hypothetical protein M9Y10_013653 [Tritrichomonas musculus]|uniref:Protein-S-isoprenylcysteine O-methyltransferase n=1 Tax=Tritrichomonas musculus TaxID=1915356 RepID=A0ABR2KXJ4_9EUKA